MCKPLEHPHLGFYSFRKPWLLMAQIPSKQVCFDSLIGCERVKVVASESKADSEDQLYVAPLLGSHWARANMANARF